MPATGFARAGALAETRAPDSAYSRYPNLSRESVLGAVDAFLAGLVTDTP